MTPFDGTWVTRWGWIDPLKKTFTNHRGTMNVPLDTWFRAFRLVKFNRDQYDYIAQWCTFQQEKNALPLLEHVDEILT